MTNYCLGFAFDVRGNVALIRKNRPEWQAGKLNGIGGHVEERESPIDAMVREFREEAGLEIPFDQWERFALMEGVGVRVDCFRALDVNLVGKVETKTDERIIVMNHNFVQADDSVIPNLRWLVPAAFDRTVSHIRAGV